MAIFSGRGGLLTDKIIGADGYRLFSNMELDFTTHMPFTRRRLSFKLKLEHPWIINE